MLSKPNNSIMEDHEELFKGYLDDEEFCETLQYLDEYRKKFYDEGYANGLKSGYLPNPYQELSMEWCNYSLGYMKACQEVHNNKIC